MQDLRCQYHLMLLGSFGFGVLYMLRVNLSVAIVAMVGTSTHIKHDNLFKESCPLPYTPKPLIKEEYVTSSRGDVDWDEIVQGRMLASFFYGYSLTNFFGGRLADKYGGRRVFGGGIFLTALLAFFLPAAAHFSEGSFAFIRLLQGMTEGVSFPAMNSLMSSWVQPSRRALIMSRIAGGSVLGTVVTLSTGGWMMQTWLGWPSLYYLSGIIGLAFSAVWFCMISDHPNRHPFITEEERAFLLEEIDQHKSGSGARNVPWGKIFTSVPFLACCFTHFGTNFGWYFLLTELPTYLSTVHHFDMKNNGLVSSLPYLLMWISTTLYANRIHHLTATKALTIRSARRLSSFLSLFCPMILLLSISYAGCESSIAVGILCVSVAVSGFSQCGILCAYQDLSPNYAGTLAGIANSIGTIPGFLAPLITGYIINNQPTIEQWNKVFVITSCIYCLSCCIYLTFMSAEVQPWNSSDRPKRSPAVKVV